MIDPPRRDRGGANLAVRAIIANASTSCTTAVRDTADACVTFTPLDGGPSVELRADSARAFSLPEGRYEVRIRAPPCVLGTDTLQVARRADDAAITRRFSLIFS